MKFFKPAKVIYRKDDIPLLIRWNLFECTWFSVKIHKLLSSDHACMHNHPWNSLGILLSGGYVEYTPKHLHPVLQRPFAWDTELEEKSQVRSRFSIIYRRASFIHRLEVHQPVYTLFITFKKRQAWGFWTKQGWTFWKNYNPQSNRCE